MVICLNHGDGVGGRGGEGRGSWMQGVGDEVDEAKRLGNGTIRTFHIHWPAHKIL